MTDTARGFELLTPAEKREMLKRLLVERSGGRTLERLPPLTPAPGERHEPFPLTDVQQAYWVGRGSNFELGQVSCHAYSEMDLVGIDLPRLNRAWQAMVEQHDMLRAIVDPDGQQRILETVPPYEIAVTDLRGEPQASVDAHIAKMRELLSHQILPSDRWPLFDIRATLLDGSRTRLHTSLDLLIVDFWSIVMLVREWFEAYAAPHAIRARPSLSFRDYVLAERQVRQTELYSRSLQYWRDRVAALPPPPDLPLAKPGGVGSRPVFVRHGRRLERSSWRRLKDRASAAGLTSSSTLLAAFTDVLAAWSRSPRFTLNLTLFYRLPFDPEVASLVGDFTSVSFLDVDDGQGDEFSARARRHQAQLWEHLEHRYISGIEVLRELARTSAGSQRALMPVVFTSLLGLTESDKSAGGFALPGDVVYAVSQTPQVWLDHQVYEQEGSLVFSWDVREDMFPPGLIADMFGAYCRLLEDLASDDAAWHALRPCALPGAQADAIRAYNATDGPLPAGRLHEASPFVDIGSRDVAVIDARRIVERAELDRAAARLARRLVDRGARPESLVAIVMEKGWEQFAAALGVLRAGAAYLPIDPHLPRERLHLLLQRGEARIAITQPWLDGQLEWPAGIARMVVDEATLEEGADAEPTADTPTPTDALAYVIFTSGSTGEPKGVMIEHGAAVNTIADINSRFDIGQSDRVLAVSSLGFDLSVYDLFGMWSAGGAVVLPRPDREMDPAHWAELLRQEHVTVWNSAPVLMKLLVEYLESRHERFPDALRLVLLSGDWIPVSLPDRIRALGPDIEVVSLGGATEASIWSIFYPIGSVDPGWTSIPYGRPLTNQRFSVLDESLEPCATWVTGELYIGGAGLSRGYWRDPDRTASSFIQHPATGERLYRTGDLGRWRPEGVIEFLGREDNQVKVQGFRIELGEIEATMRRHPAVRDVAVGTRSDDRDERRLIAGVVLSTHGARPSPSALREFVGEHLPAYMVPTEIAILDALPVTSNGKIDRKALGRLTSQPAAPAYHPAGGAEVAFVVRIGRLIAPMLGLDHIDPDEDLVNIGATSVDIVRIANLLEHELGARPNIAEFYRQPTIAGLASFYASGHGRSVEPAGDGGSPDAQADAQLLIDPAEREAFKQKRPGLRHDVKRFTAMPLPAPPPASALSAESLADRRTERAFRTDSIVLSSLSGLLAGLRGMLRHGSLKYAYPSAGGIYPVQTYVHVKAGRVEGLGEGLYYYHPVEHALVLIAEDLALDREMHEPFVNRPVFDSAAFSIFLVARHGAVRPLYGAHAARFATLEAGAMLQVLMMIAPGFGLGLCPIGDLAFDRIRARFQLDETDELVHSLLGGLTVAGARPRRRLPRTGPQVDARFDELRADAALDPAIQPTTAIVEPDWGGGQQLITGVTGFIGAHLFEQLLRRSSARFACLVRTADPDQGLLRIKEVMKRYDLWDDAFASRVVVVPGQLARPQFGLPPDEYDRLSRSCESAIHLAAQVNFIHPYAALKAANVGGVHEMLRFCCAGPAKPLHYMSTAAVWPMGGRGRFREDDDLNHGTRLDLGYYESKWVAEQLAFEARRRGLPVTIYRPGEVSGHSITGRGILDHLMLAIIKGSLQIQAAPDVHCLIDMAPVDYVASATAALAMDARAAGGTYHVNNPAPCDPALVHAVAREYGYEFTLLPVREWLDVLLAREDLDQNALYPYVHVLEEFDEESLELPVYDTTRATTALSDSGVYCPPVAATLLRRYFDWFIDVGFFPAPPHPTSDRR